MGLFDKGVEPEDFKKFQSDVFSKISNLENAIRLKATDSENTAREAAENALTIQQNIKNTESEIKENLHQLEKIKSGAEAEYVKIADGRKNIELNNEDLLAKITKIEELHRNVISSKKEFDSATSKAFEDIDKINETLEESAELPENVKRIQSLLDESSSLSESMENLHKHSSKRKSEIDILYKKINGEDITDDEDEIEHVDGLIDELNETYDALSDKLENLTKQISDAVSSITTTYEKKFEIHRASFKKLLSNSEAEFSTVKGQLTSLLPGAMAEGLSAAYDKKKNEETESQIKLEKSFKLSIFFLVLISLIPFAVDVYLLGWKGASLVEVIKDTPSLLVAILPIYFPVLWLAYSSNKKLNLSKRLIEEYTHKSVLGKTFDGLSNQIESLPKESGVSDELRTRLLFNLLQVSSENPGKLITNYEKSDHPLMEALENSSKLADSVETLLKLPGFSALANKLAVKSEKILKKEQEKIEKGLKSQDALDSEKGVEEDDDKTV